MITIFLLISVLCIVDILILKLMPKFYFYIGIPIYRKELVSNKQIDIERIAVYVGLTENLVYIIKKNTILFRSKFNYFNMYRLGIISMVKGSLEVKDKKIVITQRINLTTIYVFVLIICTLVLNKIDTFGWVFAVVIVGLMVISNMLKNVVMDNIKSEILNRYINDVT